MSADNLLYQMDHPGYSNEWFDFDNSFEFNSGYLDSDPNSVNSISPEDYSLPFPDMDPNWDLRGLCDSSFPDLVNYENQMDHVMDNTMHAFGATKDSTGFGNTTLSSDLGFDSFNGEVEHGIQDHDHYNDWVSSIRDVVEATAAADPSCLSDKAKRRDASIAIHLQRLQDTSIEREITSDSNTSFPSPSWSDFVQESMASLPANVGSVTPTITDNSSPVSPESDSVAAGVELVLDLNMNATTNLPRKQKPRSQAQKQNYIKVRKHGACEKHRKQHKRCNCLDKSATRIGIQATTATTQIAELPRPQPLQVSSVPPGRMLCQPRKNAPPGPTATHMDRLTCHRPGSANSSAGVPSQGDCPRGVLPSARRPVATNAAPLGLQTPRPLQAQQSQQLAASPSLSVSGVPPNQSTPGRQPSRFTSSFTSSSAGISVWVWHRQTPDLQTLYQAQDKIAVGRRPQQSHTNGLRNSLVEYTTTTVHRTALACCAFWQSSASVLSWIGIIGKTVLYSYKQHLAMTKGLELYR